MGLFSSPKGTNISDPRNGPGNLGAGTKGAFSGLGKRLTKGNEGPSLEVYDGKDLKAVKAGPDYQGNPSGFDVGSVYKAREYSNPDDTVQQNALNRRFDLLRDKAVGEANANAQTQNEALQRSLAAHGRIGSGVGQKQSQLLNTGLEKAKNNTVADIESQRELGGADLAKDVANRKFGFEQDEANKVFQSQEGLNQRGFAAQQSQRDDAFRTAQFNQSNQQFSQQMNMAIKQFNMDQSVTKFNEQMSKYMAGKKNMEDVIGNSMMNSGFGTWIQG
jgi:hypothetical protein